MSGFLGKTLVASAGVTVMAAFPKDKRWLTRDAALLIHGRRMVKDLHVEGPLGSCRGVLEEMIADIDHGLRLEEQSFAELIGGTKVDTEEITRRAYSGWYLTAKEAFRRGLEPVSCRKAVQCAYSALDREPCAAW